MVMLPVKTLDDYLFEQSVRNEIYHTLNEVVMNICGKSLPVAYMLYFDGLLNHYSLKMWLNKEMRE